MRATCPMVPCKTMFLGHAIKPLVVMVVYILIERTHQKHQMPDGMGPDKGNWRISGRAS